MSKPIRTSFFKETNEDWYGEFKIADDKRHEDKKYVHVSLISPLSDGITHRVCVWGNDDMGVEFDTKDLFEARNCFFAIAFLAKIDRVGLDLLGPFVPA